MKKVLLIITCLWCALYVSANPIHISASMNYTSTYKGSGRSGMVYSAPVRSTAVGSSVMAQAPVAAMGSTSISMSRGIASTSEIVAASQVRGMYTSASAIQGGVTTYNAGRTSAPRKGPGHGGNPGGLPDCDCDWQDNGDGTYTCPICGCTWSEYDDAGTDHCHCVEESGYCWCPLDFNWAVMLFFALLTAAYAVYKKRTSTLQ